MYSRLAAPELKSRISISPSPQPNVFWRCARWNWDGSALLATREDKSIQIWASPLDAPDQSLVARQAAPVLDACWYPGARTSEPATMCLAASVRDSPIKLLDASDGRLRASYRIVDHVERFVAPHSMAFNTAADKLYCGHRDAIEVFDVQSPGEGERLHTTPSRKSKDGMKGIVSALAFCPDYSGLFAAGTFTSSLWLFSEGQGSAPVCQIVGCDGPVSQIKFNPTRTHIMYAALRLQTSICAWDNRNISVPFARYERPGVGTNQRLWFDVDPTGAWLVSGSTDGTVSFHDVTGSSEEGMTSSIPVTHSFAAHEDAVGAAVFHPVQPMMATLSGSRHFDITEDSDNDSDDAGPPGQRCKPVAHDASMKLWSL